MSEDLPGMLAVAKGIAEQRWPHTTDAKVWADEFLKLNPGSDHGLMLGWFANAIMAGYDTAQARAQVTSASEKLAPAAHPGSGRLIQAYTPTTYPGQHENLPPPYVNFSEAKTPYEETILTVRSPHKSDGSAGDVAFIVITNYEVQKLLLRVARWRGWLPMTEEQWQLQHYLDSPEEAQRARERIKQLKSQRDEARRIVEETTAALSGIPTPP